MPDPRDQIELSHLPRPGGDHSHGPSDAGPRGSKPPSAKFLSLYFACAHAYGRAHRTPDGCCYRGRCPKCGKTIDFPIGAGGTSRRMFEVRCD
jgi:hypothetical protein